MRGFSVGYTDSMQAVTRSVVISRGFLACLLSFLLAFSAAFPASAFGAEDEIIDADSQEFVAQEEEDDSSPFSEGFGVLEEDECLEIDEGFSTSLDESLVVEAPTLRAQPLSAYKYNSSRTVDGLTLTVEWDEVLCGQSTTFHCSSSGAYGAPSYYLGAVYLYDNDNAAYELVTDPSQHTKNGYGYQQDPDISFTFCASGTYRVWIYVTEEAKPARVFSMSFPVAVSDPRYPSMETIADNVMAQCVAAGCKTEYEKALWLHDWVIDHIDYDYSYLYCSAEGALARGKGTCESFHRAYVKLLRRAGIASGRIEGNGHVWTAVRIDGSWCQVDATWDDVEYGSGTFSREEIRHIYFGLDDKTMGLIHPAHKNAVAGYESTTFANNYFIRNGKAAKLAEEYRARIQSRLSAGDQVFTIAADNASWSQLNYKNVINSVIAASLEDFTFQNGVKVFVSYADNSFAVTKQSISAVTVSGLAASYTYTGRAVAPSFTVSLGGKTLTRSVDYTVLYSNNVLPGTATIVVRGIGEQQGEKRFTFRIVAPAASVAYACHVQNIGWQAEVRDGAIGGTSGRSLRVEGFRVRLVNQPYAGDVRVSAHVQNVGWQGWVSGSSMALGRSIAGTSGRALRVEALRVELTGQMASYYDVYYRTHCQNVGWTGWARNGAQCGTTGCSYRMEAVQIRLVPKGGSAPGPTSGAFVHPLVTYRTHVQNIGWQGAVWDGATGGTSGRSLRVEAFRVSLVEQPYSGSIQVSSHVQNIGWQGWVSNGATSGTSGRSLRVEALKVRLTGQMAARYDVYYRTHCQNVGWTGWAKNGAPCGTAGYSYRMEAVQIRLVPKGGSAPGSTARAFYQK